MRPTPSLPLALAGLLLLAPAAWSQDGASPEHHHGHPSPYAHQGDGGVAGLSPEELQGLEDGHGMGFARPAELNHYPGPKHVLELADELRLTPEQRASTQDAFDRMAADAKRLGAEIIDRERHLDRRFRHGHVDAASLREATAEIASLYGQLRFVHLSAHLEMAELLSPQQIERYDELRGYATAAAPGAHGPGAHRP